MVSTDFEGAFPYRATYHRLEDTKGEIKEKSRFGRNPVETLSTENVDDIDRLWEKRALQTNGDLGKLANFILERFERCAL